MDPEQIQTGPDKKIADTPVIWTLPPPSLGRTALILFLALAAASVGGCVVSQGSDLERTDDQIDPWEDTNRVVHNFNAAFDRILIRPLAVTYDAVTPGFVQSGIGNFLNNLREPQTIINQALQGKFGLAGIDLARFLINSTLGLYGLIDVAGYMGLERHEEDFGQTLATWGWAHSNYLVSVFGPSTARDLLSDVGYSLAADRGGFSGARILTKSSDYGGAIFFFRGTHARAALLDAGDLLELAAIDSYVFVRSSWLQNRRQQIYDGNPPEVPATAGDDLIDDPDGGRAGDGQDLFDDLDGLDGLDDFDSLNGLDDLDSLDDL